MWIKKKEYIRMQGKLDELERDNDILSSNNDYLNKKYEKVLKEKESLEHDIKQKSSENIQLQRSITTILETNNTLNNWIERILNDVGIKELHERTGVTIPVYIQDDQGSPYKAADCDAPFVRRRKEIIIPELRFVKMG